MQIDEERVGDVTILRLGGPLEEGDTTLLSHVNTLGQEGRIKLVLDMKNVSRVDSDGLGILVGKFLTVRRRGGTIKLLRLTERVTRLMQITRMSSVFEIFDDEDDALGSSWGTPVNP